MADSAAVSDPPLQDSPWDAFLSGRARAWPRARRWKPAAPSPG